MVVRNVVHMSPLLQGMAEGNTANSDSCEETPLSVGGGCMSEK